MTAAVGGDYGSGAAHTAGPSNYHTGSKGHRIEFFAGSTTVPARFYLLDKAFFYFLPQPKDGAAEP
jgi:hypothetical protein